MDVAPSLEEKVDNVSCALCALGRVFGIADQSGLRYLNDALMTAQELLSDIHTLEEDLLAFERKFGVRSEVFYAAYAQGEEPENEAWMLDFTEWASVYRTWLARQAEYRNEISRLQMSRSSLAGLVRVLA